MKSSLKVVWKSPQWVSAASMTGAVYECGARLHFPFSHGVAPGRALGYQLIPTTVCIARMTIARMMIMAVFTDGSDGNESDLVDLVVESRCP